MMVYNIEQCVAAYCCTWCSSSSVISGKKIEDEDPSNYCLYKYLKIEFIFLVHFRIPVGRTCTP